MYRAEKRTYPRLKFNKVFCSIPYSILSREKAVNIKQKNQMNITIQVTELADGTIKAIATDNNSGATREGYGKCIVDAVESACNKLP